MDVIANLLSPILDKLQGWQDIAFIIWILWASYVFWGLKNDSDDRSRFISGMQNGLSKTYHLKLESLLDWTAKKWFKDDELLLHKRVNENTKHDWNTRLLGVNALTPSSYDFSIRLALLYPLTTMFIIWAASGQVVSIGRIVIFPAEGSGVDRLISITGMVLVVWSLYKFWVIQGWKRYIYALICFVVCAAYVYESGALIVTCSVAIFGAFCAGRAVSSGFFAFNIALVCAFAFSEFHYLAASSVLKIIFFLLLACVAFLLYRGDKTNRFKGHVLAFLSFYYFFIIVGMVLRVGSPT